jgi:glycopeptide antibiotics resistance protein
MAYKYLRDPLFVFCFALYFANRWLFKPLLPNTFSQCYFNDLICVPFWVPIMLYVMRWLRLRTDDAPPQTHEIVIPLILWSLLFEFSLPYTQLLRGRAISDHMDILFYTLGGLLAALFWKRWYRVT